MSQKQVENRLSNQYKKPSNKIVENSDMAFRTVDISNKTEKKKIKLEVYACICIPSLGTKVLQRPITSRRSLYRACSNFIHSL